MHPQTKFFQACRGVFEGGGCRGAAHIGAFDAAIKCGVNFSEVAGTSAGSIIAALIGAGATPEFLLEKCASLQFSELLDKPKKRVPPIIDNWFLSWLLGDLDHPLINLLFVDSSIYSSTKIEEWLDSLLAELLPHAQRPIRFQDLVIPTSIVAADLTGRRYKLWSTENDQGDKVAMAVRCSCSIPVFFEPVESGNDFLVDGGILSNLPAFVFADKKNTSSSLGGRILAFRLVGEDPPNAKWNLIELIKRLLHTMIDGATELQGRLQPGIYSVKINTGNVLSTDFNITPDNVDFLLEQGREAMETFILNEHKELADGLDSDLTRSGEDELFDDLVREMATPGQRLLVTCEDTVWFWKLFPSIAYWLFNGAEVDILTKKISGDSAKARKEKLRRKNLQMMGARIVCSDDIDPICFIISRKDDHHDAAFICDTSSSVHSPAGMVYIGIKHRAIIRALRDKISEHFRDEHELPSLRLTKCGSDQLIKLLKCGVNQYMDSSVSIEERALPLTNMEPLSLEMIVRRVRTFKFRQVEYLASLYKKFDIPFCAPAEIRANDEVVSVVTPPVLEQRNDSLIAIEGNTRLFHSLRSHSKSLSCLVVKGVSAPLPGRPVKPQAVLLTTNDLKSSERIEGFNYDNFRSIERAARPIDEEEGD